MARQAEDSLIELGEDPFSQFVLPDILVAPTPSIIDSPSGSMLVRGEFSSSNFRKGFCGWSLDAYGNLEANNGIFRGALVANSLDIPDTVTANSFHVDKSGNAWWGATLFAAAIASISKAGAAIFSNIVIKGGSININNMASIDVAGNATFNSATLLGTLSASKPVQMPTYSVATLPTTNVAGTAADDSSVGSVAWTTPNNAKSFGIFSAFANDATNVSVQTHYLKLTNFGLAVPGTATILGISVEIDRNASVTGSCKDTVVKLVKSSGSLGTNNNADVTNNWPTNKLIKLYGGPGDLWGDAWAPADVNNANFGAVLSITFKNSGGTFPSVYGIRVNVYYTNGGLPVETGAVAYALDGRKNGEGAGLGTGVMTFHDGRAWKACDTGATVAA